MLYRFDKNSLTAFVATGTSNVIRLARVALLTSNAPNQFKTYKAPAPVATIKAPLYSLNDSRFKKIDIDHCLFNKSFSLNKIDISYKISLSRSFLNLDHVFINDDIKKIEIKETKLFVGRDLKQNNY